MLDSIVLALVIPALKTLVETTENMKIPMEKAFNETKDQIGEAQKKITALLAGKKKRRHYIFYFVTII
jgi:hypothetical protein